MTHNLKNKEFKRQKEVLGKLQVSLLDAYLESFHLQSEIEFLKGQIEKKPSNFELGKRVLERFTSEMKKIA